MNWITRVASPLPLALLLWGCPKEQKQAIVRVEGGKVVMDGDRSDCIVGLGVSNAKEVPGAAPIWSTESPMPISNDSTCPMRFPVMYGTAPDKVSVWPNEAPRLEPGRRYRVSVDGMNAEHIAEFIAP